MRQHEWVSGKSGRKIRQRLKQVREAAGGGEQSTADGTEIAGSSGGQTGQEQSAARVLDRLTSDSTTADRLRQFQARQQRLPLDIEASVQEPGAQTPAKQTRDVLVERLLDPVLTLQETAVLLDVCPTTVRRYTNRGVLNCFRTPGNQRRFRLSDVISFMERRDTQT